MKITELDLKTEGKRYKCGNSMFVIKNGDLFDVEMHTYLKDSCISVAELVEMEFKEVNQIKNPYTRVNNREKYYSIIRDGSINSLHEDRAKYDNKVFSTANYFNNKEYAEYIAFKESLMRRIDRFAWDYNARVVNWDDESTKYFITFDVHDKKLDIHCCISYQSNNICFKSREIAEKAIEKFKDDLMKLYTWKFDV